MYIEIEGREIDLLEIDFVLPKPGFLYVFLLDGSCESISCKQPQNKYLQILSKRADVNQLAENALKICGDLLDRLSDLDPELVGKLMDLSDYAQRKRFTIPRSKTNVSEHPDRGSDDRSPSG